MRTIRRRLELALSTGTEAMDLHQLSHALFASMNATRRSSRQIRGQLDKDEYGNYSLSIYVSHV